jgi:DNA-binding MarR family transcriptional regulator
MKSTKGQVPPAGILPRTHIAGRLHRVAIRLLREARRDDPEGGLRPAPLSALSVLVFGGPRTLGELAAAEQVTAPTMSRLVSGLVRQGYVERTGDPGDARLVLVAPTSQAVTLLHELRRMRAANVRDLIGELDEEKWATLAAAVEILERAMEGSPETEPASLRPPGP